jgi:hypothetical protein
MHMAMHLYVWLLFRQSKAVVIPWTRSAQVVVREQPGMASPLFVLCRSDVYWSRLMEQGYGAGSDCAGVMAELVTWQSWLHRLRFGHTSEIWSHLLRCGHTFGGLVTPPDQLVCTCLSEMVPYKQADSVVETGCEK